MIYVLLLIFYFGFPALIILLTLKNKIADKIGAVVISYIVGLIIGNVGLIPAEYIEFQNFIVGLTVAIAIPLLLFSANLKLWYRLIGKTFLSLILGLFSVVVVVYLGYFIFRDKIDDIWQISGMLVGLYSGGDPNLASLKTALGVEQNRFIITHTSDLAFGAFFLLFIMVAGKKTFESFLPKFSMKQKENMNKMEDSLCEFHNFNNFFHKKSIPNLIIGLFLSIFIVGIAYFGGELSPSAYATTISILLITTLGLGASFIKKVRELKKTFQLGMYFIIVFSLIIASMADFSVIFQLKSLYILLYVILVVVLSIIIHALLSKIFKIDADTLIITTIALLYSVPFIPVVASTLKNKYIIISGIVIALFGYAIGNYLGIVVAYSLK